MLGLSLSLSLGAGGRVLPPAGYAFVVHNGEPVTYNGQSVIVRIA